MIITGGRVFIDGTFSFADIVISDDIIVAITEPGQARTLEAYTNYEVMDVQGNYVVPAFVDVHFHGCMGHDFCEGTSEAISLLAQYEASRGVTAICPATMTYPEEVLSKIAIAARTYEPKKNESALVGINMEGPFISPYKVGAQNPAYVQSCNIDEMRRLMEKSNNLFKIVDVAPEEPGALEFIEAMRDEVRISIAHTCATYDEATRAFEAGAKQVTHLYNAMPGMNHRAPGVIPAALENGATPEIIADGVHIHPAMVRLAFKMFGDDRMILISDSMEATGMPDGEYQIGGQPVTKKGNMATLHDGTLAGSVTDLADCVRICVTDMGVALESSLKAATCNPAKAIGVQDKYGYIAQGSMADIVILDDEIRVKTVILRGNVL